MTLHMDLRAVTVAKPGPCRTCRGLGRVNTVYDAATNVWDGDDCPDCDGVQTARGVSHD